MLPVAMGQCIRDASARGGKDGNFLRKSTIRQIRRSHKHVGSHVHTYKRVRFSKPQGAPGNGSTSSAAAVGVKAQQ
jgi:hypothetical protein